MKQEVKLNHLHDELASLQYPVSQAEASEVLAGVTLLYADGEESLAAVVARSTVDEFADAADLESEIYGNLPVEAVGEPGQSEGDA